MDPSGSAPASAARFSPSGFLRAPVSYLLSYAGVLRPPRHADAEAERGGGFPDAREPADDVSPGGSGEVSIRIIGGGDQADPVAGTGQRQHLAVGYRRQRSVGESGIGIEQLTSVPDRAGVDGAGERASSSSSSTPQASSTGEVEADGSSAAGSNSYQRYDVQHFARWIEQILPFSLLLLVVFIRQHLQGFFVTIWIAAVMFKSNEILKNQTSLKGERKISVLVCFTVICSVHVVGFYWWYRNDDLLYPLIMVPLKDVPAFWNAVFVVMVNDTMVRQAAMIYKCILLIYYRNSKGRSYRRQGQMLTLVEYFLLLYRALVPTPVWYRFFLNKEYGSLFSSLTTGLYLTFKLTTVVEKVRSFITAFKALFHTEVQYGSHATLEQVIAAGDLCAICQEKMHSPILLRCKHIFCEDCVSEWFEREGTCPLCRTLVKPAELRSYSDGSTSLFFQLF